MSGIIKVLEPTIAERIAAGEVIERPASVVKELVENSLDAGASEIAVILEDGGKALIEIIDNGAGMGPDDLSLCTARHATSKLSSLDDLERIRTLGFRGEALASVAAVSDLTLISRTKNATDASSSAYQFKSNIINSASISAQPITFGHFLGSPHGTTIRALGLFAQIPARLKFLKSKGAELMQVREWMERLAITHPQVGFRLTSDDRTVLNLRPQDEISRIRTILADGDDLPIISSRDSSNSIRVHWIQGLSSPQTRKLVQIVNKRAVRDRILQQAMMGPFRQALMPGQFPALTLFVDIDPSRLDVNVHPTKTEIRFLDSRSIFLNVQNLIESMIRAHGSPGFVSYQGMAPGYMSEKSRDPWDLPIQHINRDNNQFQPKFSEQQEMIPPPSHPLRPEYFTGIIFNTYLIYQLDGEIAVVDQHAAHERIRYERIKNSSIAGPNDGPRPSQNLLIPESIQFSGLSRAQIKERINWLNRLGFVSELFSENAVLFRAIPPEWGTGNLSTRLKNLLESDTPMDETLFETMASEACHSAVRAGDQLEHIEAISLVEDLFTCEHPWNCPHGRPTVVRIPKNRFEEWFNR